jgi:uncharacterized protein
MIKSIQLVLSLVAAAGTVLLLAGGLRSAEEPKTAPADGKKIRTVVVVGGHGYDKGKFPSAFAGNADIAVDIREIKEEGKKGVFEDIENWPYDVMVLYSFGQQPSDAEKANFLKLLDRGVGLVILHHAIAGYPDWDEYEKILGAKYCLKAITRDGVELPPSIWKEGVEVKVHVEDPNHPITKGVKDFSLVDETYGKWTYHPGSHVLLTTDNPLNTKQICWAKTYAKSRVFFLQLGHGPDAFVDKNYQHLVAQGIRWTAGRLADGKAKAEK